MTTTIDPRSVASDWLAACATALSGESASAVAALFLPDGWLRDLLVFTWDIRALAGRTKIAAYVANALARARISDLRLNDALHYAPAVVPVAEMHGAPSVELAFTFECAHGHGRAHARLMKDTDGIFRALTLLLEVYDIPGHEELITLPLRDDVKEVAGRDMQQEFEEYAKQIETKPYVLIGASYSCPPACKTSSLTQLPAHSGCGPGGADCRSALQTDEHPHTRHRPPPARWRLVAATVSHSGVAFNQPKPHQYVPPFIL